MCACPVKCEAIFVNKKSKRYVGKDVGGGNAVRLVSRWFDAVPDAPVRFEPGTQDLEGAIEWSLGSILWGNCKKLKK